MMGSNAQAFDKDKEDRMMWNEFRIKSRFPVEVRIVSS